jgi:hypothetical protein
MVILPTNGPLVNFIFAEFHTSFQLSLSIRKMVGQMRVCRGGLQNLFENRIGRIPF